MFYGTQRVKNRRLRDFRKARESSIELTRGELVVARVLVLRLKKESVSIKTSHALYRDNGS